MSDEQGPEIIYEMRMAGGFLLGVLLFSSLIILENAPSESIGLLLSLVGAVYIIALVVVLVFLLQGTMVFGYAAGYPILPGAIFGIIAFWLTTTDASSIQITIVASGGLISMLAAGGVALYSAHRE